jgi:hypothetical protein
MALSQTQKYLFFNFHPPLQISITCSRIDACQAETLAKVGHSEIACSNKKSLISHQKYEALTVCFSLRDAQGDTNYVC